MFFPYFLMMCFNQSKQIDPQHSDSLFRNVHSHHVLNILKEKAMRGKNPLVTGAEPFSDCCSLL